eukprot:m.66961 g.66961  ORF g.66961 m.66961 type:complete len:281 (-) comp49920_c0_seq1:506-1348(-)
MPLAEANPQTSHAHQPQTQLGQQTHAPSMFAMHSSAPQWQQPFSAQPLLVTHSAHPSRPPFLSRGPPPLSSMKSASMHSFFAQPFTAAPFLHAGSPADHSFPTIAIAPPAAPKKGGSSIALLAPQPQPAAAAKPAGSSPTSSAQTASATPGEEGKKKRRRRRRRCRRSRKSKSAAAVAADGLSCTAQLIAPDDSESGDAASRLSLTLRRGLSFHDQINGMFDSKLSFSACTSAATNSADADADDEDFELDGDKLESLNALVGSEEDDDADSDASGDSDSD